MTIYNRILSTYDYPALERTLGDTPATLIPRHRLRTGQTQVGIVGSPYNFKAVAIQVDNELVGFGTHGEHVWNIMAIVGDYDFVEVSLELAEHVIKAFSILPYWIEHRLYYALFGVRLSPPKPQLEVRLLSPDDIAVWQTASAELNTFGFPSHLALLTEGFAAGAFDNGELVALAHTSAVSAAYAHIGVYTSPAYRGLGLATYGASLVMEPVVAQGRIPIWSADEENLASQRVAQKLGMSPIAPRVKLAPAA